MTEERAGKFSQGAAPFSEVVLAQAFRQTSRSATPLGEIQGSLPSSIELFPRNASSESELMAEIRDLKRQVTQLQSQVVQLHETVGNQALALVQATRPAEPRRKKRKQRKMTDEEYQNFVKSWEEDPLDIEQWRDL